MMIAILVAGILAQADEDLPFPPDPFDHSMPPLSVNDTDPKAEQDPSFLHVGICTGSDIGQKPILIADRLCLNRPAVELVAGNAKACADELTKLGNENEATAKVLVDTDNSRTRWFWLAQFYFFSLIMLLAYCYRNAKS